MEEIDKTNINALFSQTAVLKSKFEELAKLSGFNFNIFKIMKMQTDEVFLHSSFIAELLNPKGVHNKKTQFLNLFLKDIIAIIPPLVMADGSTKKFEIDADSAIVKTEMYIGDPSINDEEGGRIDIIVYDKNDSVLVIENKIYAPDQPKQILRYKNFGMKHNTHLILYLNLEGTPPDSESVQSLIKDKDYFCINYKSEIKNWLSKCVEIAFDQPFLRETLQQYIIVINQLTNQLTFNIMEKEMIELLSRNMNYTYVNDIISGYNALKIQTQFHFWNEILDKIDESINPIPCSPFQRKFSENECTVFKKTEYDFATIDFTYLSEISEICKSEYKFYFKVSQDSAGCYYGFISERSINNQKTSKNANDESFKPIVEFLQNLKYEKSDWHFGWKYTDPKINFIKFDESAEALVNVPENKHKRDEFIRKIANEIISDLEKFIQKFK